MSQSLQPPPIPTPPDTSKPGKAKSPAMIAVAVVLLVLVMGFVAVLNVGLAAAVKWSVGKSGPFADIFQRSAPGANGIASTQPIDPDLRKMIEARRPLILSFEKLAVEHIESTTEFRTFDPRELETREGIDDRIGKIDRWNAASEKLTDYYTHFEERVAKAAFDAVQDKAQADAFAQETAAKLQVREDLEIRAAEQEFLAAHREMLLILRDHHGMWEISKADSEPPTQPSTGPMMKTTVTFAPDQDDIARRYRLAHERMLTAIDLFHRLTAKQNSERDAGSDSDVKKSPSTAPGDE